MFSRKEAQQAAKAMAEEHPGEVFYVMQSTDSYETGKVVHKDLTKAP